MWITKVIFKDSDGKIETFIHGSTEEHRARFYYGDEIEKWLKNICKIEMSTLSYPHHDVMLKNNNKNNISLEIIQLFINAINKENNNTNMSFEISMYEEN